MITGNIITDYKCSLTNGTNEFYADVEKNLGGSRQGPSPHEILEAALSACTLMTLQSYAKIKKIEIGNLVVEVNIEKEGAQTNILRNISFDPSLSSEDRQKLLIIADKCPIHKLLLSSIEIETQVK